MNLGYSLARCGAMWVVGLTMAVAARAQPEPVATKIDCEDFRFRGTGGPFGGLFEITAAPGELLLRLTRDIIDPLPAEDVVFRYSGREYRASELPREELFRLRVSDARTPGWRSLHADAATLDDSPFYRRFPKAFTFFEGTEDRHANISPGIDFGHHRAAREFRFVCRPGTDPSRLVLSLEPIDKATVEVDRLIYEFRCGRLVFGEPRVVRIDDEVEHGLPASYGGTCEAAVIVIEDVQDLGEDSLLRKTDRPGAPTWTDLAGEFRFVPAGGMQDGPEYDFYVSRFETTNLQFQRFLNDLERRTNEDFTANVFFDGTGNVWFNSEMQARRDELFSIATSRLEYDRQATAGRRYRISARQARDGGSFTNHPVTGVSWYGALKYCNWLTLESGRGPEALCYREGTAPEDWAPVTSARTNWVRGVFTEAEREAFIALDGFRLPVDHSVGFGVMATNRFNEFLKMATWHIDTNTWFATGYMDARPENANFSHAGFFMKRDTAPVGFYNGSDHDGFFQTHSNRNAHRIYDLSGNVREWLTDPGESNLLYRAAVGGSWFDPPVDARQRDMMPPWQTVSYAGFRVMTVSEGGPVFLVSLPYVYCVCGAGGLPEPEEEPEVPEPEPEPEVPEPDPPPGLPGLDDPGVIPSDRPDAPPPIRPPDVCPG